MTDVAQEQHIVVQVEAGVGWIRFNRPERMNAIGGVARRQLGAAIKQVGRDPEVRCVVLTGEGRAFCAGADVREMGQEAGMRTPADVGRILREEYMPQILALRQMPKPVLAGLNGVAAGIGASYAMAADLRIATPEANLVEAFVGIGLMPDGGATWMLPRLAGAGKAMELILTGRPLAASEAERFGLYNQVVPADVFPEVLREWAARLAAGPTVAMGNAKRALYHALNSSLEDAMEYESYLQEVTAASEDFAEGVSAFVAKRQPEFKGR